MATGISDLASSFGGRNFDIAIDTNILNNIKMNINMNMNTDVDFCVGAALPLRSCVCRAPGGTPAAPRPPAPRGHRGGRAAASATRLFAGTFRGPLI